MSSDRIVKALFLVASEPPQSPVSERYADVEHVLIEMGAEATGDEGNLLRMALAATTSPGELMRLKELAKRLAKDAETTERLEAARLLYHSSVVSAFLHHDTWISGRARRKEQPLYEMLAEEWEGHVIGELFRRMTLLTPASG